MGGAPVEEGLAAYGIFTLFVLGMLIAALALRRLANAAG